MSSLKEIRGRVKSVKNTRQITKAMQLVASVKMKKSQAKSLASSPYAEAAWEIIGQLMGKVNSSEHDLLKVRQGKKSLIILVTTNRGLCGGLNAKALKKAVELSKNKEVDFITVGKKGRDFLRIYGYNIVADFSDDYDKFDETSASPVVKVAIDDYLKGQYSDVYLIYTHFVNTLSQEPKVVPILPFTKENFADIVTEDYKETGIIYNFEPSIEEVLGEMIERILEFKLYQAVLENAASEHSARMVAMKNATDNAGDLIEDLTLYANKVRQANITKELSEIVAGSL